MAEPPLSMKSAKAHRLAWCEHPVVEPASVFYARLSLDKDSDIDLEAIIRESRRANETGIDIVF